MSRVAVIYWSGTGNTEIMARAVADGARTAGAEADVFRVEEFSPELAAGYEAQAWGCPAQGEEMVEQDVFLPCFMKCVKILRGKKVALFGSHGLGDGTFMMDWEDACDDLDIELAAESVICREKPDAAALVGCYELGHRLARLAG